MQDTCNGDFCQWVSLWTTFKRRLLLAPASLGAAARTLASLFVIVRRLLSCLTWHRRPPDCHGLTAWTDGRDLPQQENSTDQRQPNTHTPPNKMQNRRIFLLGLLTCVPIRLWVILHAGKRCVFVRGDMFWANMSDFLLFSCHIPLHPTGHIGFYFLKKSYLEPLYPFSTQCVYLKLCPVLYFKTLPLLKTLKRSMWLFILFFYGFMYWECWHFISLTWWQADKPPHTTMIQSHAKNISADTVWVGSSTQMHAWERMRRCAAFSWLCQAKY